jgi:hypothetical protein
MNGDGSHRNQSAPLARRLGGHDHEDRLRHLSRAGAGYSFTKPTSTEPENGGFPS